MMHQSIKSFIYRQKFGGGDMLGVPFRGSACLRAFIQLGLSVDMIWMENQVILKFVSSDKRENSKSLFC